MKNKFSKLLAAVALAAVATAAVAGGIYTVGYPNIPAASFTSGLRIPVDTNYSGGQNPQTAYITAGDVKTYANGGATVSATATAGAATANGETVTITSEALTTAAGAVYTLTLTDSSVTAASVPLCSVGNGTNTTVGPSFAGVTPGAGSATIVVRNTHASAALNGTIEVNCRFVNN